MLIQTFQYLLCQEPRDGKRSEAKPQHGWELNVDKMLIQEGSDVIDEHHLLFLYYFIYIYIIYY